MKILVIGGAGYIGSALSPYLLNHGHHVVVVDNFWFGDHLPEASSNFSKIGREASTLTANDLRGFEVVIFLAGLSNDPMANYDPYDNFVQNAALPAYIAHLCGEAEVKRFIHGGSSSVYGRIARGQAAHEGTPVQGNTPYGLSKHMAEIGCGFAKQHGVEVVLFRMGTVCGYSPRMRFDLIINNMTKDAFTKGVIGVNDPESERPILDIRDLVVAYELACHTPNVSGIMNLISSNASIMEIAEAVRDKAAEYGEDVDINIRGIKDIRSYRCNAYEAAGKLGFMPSYTDVADTVDHVMRNWTKISNPLDPMHYNIETFKALKGERLLAAG